MKERLKDELKIAMKAKDRVKLNTIRSIMSALQYEEMQKEVEELPEPVVIEVLKRERKKRLEEVEFAKQAGREEQLEQLSAEIATIDSFLPAQLNEQELEKIIVGLKEESPEINMGLAMKTLKENYAGQYDGKLASSIAKRVLG